MYLALGSINGVSKLINIPVATVFLWKSTKWWQELIRQFKTQENLVLSNKLKSTLDKSIELVNDRLEHGDYLYDQKTGEIRRKPVLMKDALKVATEFIDKRQKIERPEYEQVAQEGVMERLEKLAKSFEEIAIRKNSDEKPIVIEVTDVIFSEGKTEPVQGEKEGTDYAVAKGREEGLQEGVRQVPQPAGTKTE